MHMPNAYDMLRWIHFLCAALAGGGMVMCLLVSGFEDTREDLRGLAAALWARAVAWSLRLGVLAGAGLLLWAWRMGASPFLLNWIWVKLPLALVLLAVSETAPRALAAGKRGGALLALLLFLLASFASYNKTMFGFRPAGAAPAQMQSGQ